MADSSPSWESIANKLRDVLSENGLTCYYTYPEAAIDNNELPCVVINEPQDTIPSAFTMGAFDVTYTGELSLLVKAVDTGQARLFAQDINQIEAYTLRVFALVHANRAIKNFASFSLGSAKTARFSPYDPDNRGHYAGKTIPYTIHMQYRSGL